MVARRCLGIAIFLVVFVAGCAKDQSIGSSSSPELPAAKLVQVENPTQGFVPDRSPAAVGVPVAKGTVTVTERNAIRLNGLGMVRFDEPFAGKEFLVDLGEFTQASDFGANGSITLVAKTTNYPLSGNAYPVLTSFYVDTGGGITEFVHLSSGCFGSGMWTCSGSSCVANPSCAVNSTSAFSSRQDWDQHQVPSFGFVSTNDFPRCNPAQSGEGCFAEGLPSGHYFAKYVLLSNSGGSVSSYTAGVEVRVLVKKDTEPGNTENTPVNGGLNLNLVLVGNKNIQDSRSGAGQRNLNLLLRELNRLLKEESGANLGLNEIKVYEWSDENGGSRYSGIELDRLGDMFESGSKGLPSTDDGRYLNVFLVSDIVYDSSLTVLGLSGGILGPPVNGTQSSGVAFSTFDQLGTFNSSCGSLSCGRANLDEDFLEMASTIGHELGHYLGLNHPSERPDNGGIQDHDGLTDTPRCAARTVTSQVYLDARACYAVDTLVQPAPLSGATCKARCDAITSPLVYLSGFFSTTPQSFCPAVAECQFNHIMWYTTKNRKKEGGVWKEDGNLISQQSSSVLQRSYMVR
ncbi:MAG: hypothetical protein KGP28_05985 [Bdellovibrionales bacterium]|nr:hypothetical protein [Bdellovibrionales bacterium]